MLDQLQCADFQSHQNETFEVKAGDQTFSLQLIDASPFRETLLEGETRCPFSVVFRGPKEPILWQAIYPLHHGKMGDLELFLVPLGPDAEGMRYEAVFT